VAVVLLVAGRLNIAIKKLYAVVIPQHFLLFH